MKLYLNITLLTLMIFSLSSCGNHGNAEANFKTWGNCDMCKETIEKSLKVEGVASAEWNKDSKMLHVSYDSTKTSLDRIEKSVAAAGYDTELYQGDSTAYSSLPECCQYDRK